MNSRHWSGPHLAHPVWHWVWLTDDNRHGYGPTYALAMAAALKCRPAAVERIAAPAGFKRRM